MDNFGSGEYFALTVEGFSTVSAKRKWRLQYLPQRWESFTNRHELSPRAKIINSSRKT
jgi:hypothetical protein